MAIVEDYFYDTEFLERGPQWPVELISIGVKRRSLGWGYYAVSSEFDMHAAWYHQSGDGTYWLRENVLKQLPLVKREDGSIWLDGDGVPLLRQLHPSVKSRAVIRQDLEQFFQLKENIKRRLWAWYADYDHVVLSQLWGTMAQLPEGMPMFTHDLKQVVDMAGNPPMPPQPEGHAHHALDDAAHLAAMWEFCRQLGILLPTRPEYDARLARPVIDNPSAQPKIHVNRCRGDDCPGHD